MKAKSGILNSSQWDHTLKEIGDHWFRNIQQLDQQVKGAKGSSKRSNGLGMIPILISHMPTDIYFNVSKMYIDWLPHHIHVIKWIRLSTDGEHVCQRLHAQGLDTVNPNSYYIRVKRCTPGFALQMNHHLFLLAPLHLHDRLRLDVSIVIYKSSNLPKTLRAMILEQFRWTKPLTATAWTSSQFSTVPWRRRLVRWVDATCTDKAIWREFLQECGHLISTQT